MVEVKKTQVKLIRAGRLLKKEGKEQKGGSVQKMRRRLQNEDRKQAKIAANTIAWTVGCEPESYLSPVSRSEPWRWQATCKVTLWSSNHCRVLTSADLARHLDRSYFNPEIEIIHLKIDLVLSRSSISVLCIERGARDEKWLWKPAEEDVTTRCKQLLGFHLNITQILPRFLVEIHLKNVSFQPLLRCEC